MRDKSINAINKMLENIDNMNYEDFSSNDMLVEATIFAICQIGENVKNIDVKIQEKYSNVIWHVLKSLRNRIVHDYDGVNLELIWSII